MKITFDNRRAVEEWVADHPDQQIPARVKARLVLRYEGKCAITGVKLRAGEIDFDHIKPLRNGGQHRESNLQPLWRKRHQEKTKMENSDGAKADRIFAKHHGLNRKSTRKIQSRGFERRGQR